MAVRRRRSAHAHALTNNPLEWVSEKTAGARTFVARMPWWQTTLLVIGFVATVTVIGVMFLGFNSPPTTITLSDRVAPIDTPQFATTVARLVGSAIERGGTVEVLNNGDEFLPSLLASIRSAQQSINFSVFMWKSGEFSDRVMEALIERQQHGVAVRVLLDGWGGTGMPGAQADALKKAGGHVAKFRTPGLVSWTRYHRRNHRRAIVIDGRVGFTGGMAVVDHWLGHAQDPKHWRDMMFKVTGPLAVSLQAAFADEWVSSSGEILSGSEMYPELPENPSGVERFIQLANSPADDDQSMAYFFLLPVLAARQRITITTPYFIPSEPFVHALEQQARAGIDVRLLLPGSVIDDKLERWAAHRFYDRLLEAGVRIFEYAPTFIHSKTMVVDGKWSVIGSPNLNTRSRDLDEENAFGILDEALARQLEAVFADDLKRSTEIQLKSWRGRNPFWRLLEFASRVVDKQS